MPDVKTNGTAFKRDGVFGIRSNGLARSISVWAAEALAQDQDPRRVDETTLESMSTHPSIYLAERMTTGVIRREDLYTVEHKDPKVVKEVEEWLWPLLPKILNAFARAYAYGARGLVFDWGTEDLVTEVPKASGTGTRTRRLPAHKHYVKVHGIRRSEINLKLNSDDLVSFDYFRQTFPASRAHVLRWDPEDEGDWKGQGARVRCWRDFCALLVIDSLEAGYLERSVDPPRKASVPEGSQEVDGVTLDNATYMTDLLMSLRGAGVLALPSATDANGNKQWDVEAMDLPDREGVWLQAIKRREVRLFEAYLALLGGDSASASKTLDGIAKELIQDLANWVAVGLTAIIEPVHRANHNHDKVPAPEIKSTDVGKAGALKVMTEVLRIVGAQGVTRWLDIAKLMDRLNLPLLDSPEEDGAVAGLPVGVAPSPGRDRDLIGDRDERRDNARTEEGEEDTGQRNGRENSENLARQAMDIAKELAARPPAPAPNISLTVEAAAPANISVEPHVNLTVEPAQVKVPDVSVSVKPAQVTINQTVEAAEMQPFPELPTPEVNITVEPAPAPAPIVNVNPTLKLPDRKTTTDIERDNKGFITRTESETKDS